MTKNSPNETSGTVSSDLTGDSDADRLALDACLDAWDRGQYASADCTGDLKPMLMLSFVWAAVGVGAWLYAFMQVVS